MKPFPIVVHIFFVIFACLNKQTVSLKTTRFKVNVPEEQLQGLKAAVNFARLPPPFFEGTQPALGVTSNWMRGAKERWTGGYDWRTFEAKLNTFEHFIADVPFEASTFKLHYIHALSPSPNAIPLLMLHGWPGSFAEFLDSIKPLSEQGFDVVVPSLPGWCWSEKPPVDRHFGLEATANLLDGLMQGLGYKEYAVQEETSVLPLHTGWVTKSPLVKVRNMRIPLLNILTGKIKPPAVHTNVLIGVPLQAPPGAPPLTPWEQEGLNQTAEFSKTGNGYAIEHATRPSTISHVLYSSPLALLAWAGEKFLTWSDDDLTLDTILNMVTLWDLTDTSPFSIYGYRELLRTAPYSFDPTGGEPYFKKPFGLSYFAKELSRYPFSWVAAVANLQWNNTHNEGGHFAALEKPRLFVNDVVKCFAVLWPMRDMNGTISRW